MMSESSEDDSSSTSPGFNRFARDSSRQSLTSQNVLKWASAQEKQQQQLSPGQSRTAAASTAPSSAALEIQTDLQKVINIHPLNSSNYAIIPHNTRTAVMKNDLGYCNVRQVVIYRLSLLGLATVFCCVCFISCFMFLIFCCY